MANTEVTPRTKLVVGVYFMLCVASAVVSVPDCAGDAVWHLTTTHWPHY